jgi:hypothetical protein
MLEYVLILVVVGVVAAIALRSADYSVVEWIIFAFFMVVIAIVGAQYFFGVNITASVQQLLNSPKINVDIVNTGQDPDKEKDPEKKKEPDGEKQVFHVPGQYDYMNAKALCRAYGGKLADIAQVNDAYKKGGEWCNYGWSEDQMALYPTQTKTWLAFKETELHEQDCGRPGVNGGYFNNPNEKLGANCFARKPAQVGELTPLVIPKSANETVDPADLPPAAPFNYTQWSE